MGITGDFKALEEMQKDLQGLRELAPRTLRSAAQRVKPALDRYFAPGEGHGWAPQLTATATAGELVVDSGGPARVPDGIPEDIVAQALADALAEESK